MIHHLNDRNSGKNKENGWDKIINKIKNVSQN